MRYDLGLSVFFAWCKLTELGSIFFKYGICLNDLYILLYGLKVTFSVLREDNIWFIPMCLPEPKIFLKFPQWWLGDPHFPFYWNIWQSTEWKIPAFQLHIMDGPLHQVCIKVTKASYRDQVISLEQEKVPAFPPYPSALG